MGDTVTYEGEEMYQEKKDDQLFAMDRFDPDSEFGAETILPDNTKSETEKASQSEGCEKPQVNEVKRKRRNKPKKAAKPSVEAEGFTVLGDPTDSQKKKVARVLPQWLAQPDIMQVLLFFSIW